MRCLTEPLHDDRGRTVRAGALARERFREVRADTSRKRAFKALKKQEEFTALIHGLLIGLLIPVISLLVTNWSPVPAVPKFIQMGVAAMAISLMVLPVSMAIGRSNRQQRRALIRDPLLKARLCLACTHDLAGASTEPDGCTVCPECGAAWRLPEAMKGQAGEGWRAE